MPTWCWRNETTHLKERAMATKPKPKKKSTKKKDTGRKVDYLTVERGRRSQRGGMLSLFARIERRDGKVSASLGSSFEKLQIRVTLPALREIVKEMEKLA